MRTIHDVDGYARIAYAPSSDAVHLWLVQDDGTKDYLFACDEVCHGDECLGPDDFDEEREVSVGNVVVERTGDTATVTFEDVAVEE